MRMGNPEGGLSFYMSNEADAVPVGCPYHQKELINDAEDKFREVDVDGTMIPGVQGQAGNMESIKNRDCFYF